MTSSSEAKEQASEQEGSGCRIRVHMLIRVARKQSRTSSTSTFTSPGTIPPLRKSWSRAIDAKCERLARSPMIGRARPELRPDLRSFPFGAYLILYRAIDDGAEVVRVVHAARNLDDLV